MSDTVTFDTATFDVDTLLSGLTPAELLAIQEGAEDRLRSATLTRENDDEVLDLLRVRERTSRKSQIFDASLYIAISDRSAFRRAGYLSTSALYAQAVRLGDGEARRRKLIATEIGRFTTMTGEPREPNLSATAAAVADGKVGRENVLVIAEIMDRLPHSVAHDERMQAEAMLAAAAHTLDPAAVTTVGNRILSWLDPDGALSDDTDRRRRRTFVVQPQNRQLMSKVRAQLTPKLRATLEVTLTQWAAPGMNNPADPESPRGAANQPGLDQAILAAAAERDDRTIGQRQHDALESLCEWANALAGQQAPDRIPAQVVITVSDEDLARQAGVALTATGTRIPVAELVEFAAQAVPHLEVFAGGTSQILYLGRGNRFASPAQRLALFGRDRGCTAPGCTVPFSRTQAHHMPDWAEGGVTDVDHLGGACGKHNRWNGRDAGQWESTILTDGPETGRVGWRPVGRPGDPWLVNPMFHPERLRPGQPVPDLNNRLGDIPATGHSDSGPPGDVPATGDQTRRSPRNRAHRPHPHRR